jgi:hypothetical protein
VKVTCALARGSNCWSSTRHSFRSRFFLYTHLEDPLAEAQDNTASRCCLQESPPAGCAAHLIFPQWVATPAQQVLHHYGVALCRCQMQCSATLLQM